MKKIVLSVLTIVSFLLFSFVTYSRATEVNIPNDYFIIQEAIDNSNNGDVIIIGPGTYYENINFMGKDITVRSTDPNDPDIVAATIIDGNQQDSVVIFNSGEESNTVLSGITIQNGKVEHPGEGPGIRCELSSPTITKCNIIKNLNDPDSCDGGTLWCKSCSPIINNCLIAENYGSCGIYCCESSPIITHCTIKENHAEAEGARYDVGGILCQRSSSPLIAYCTITKNSADSCGGISCRQSSPTITHCLISENYGLGSYGVGGISCYASSPNIINCLITKNKGIGIFCSSFSSPGIINCTICENSAPTENPDSIHIGGGISCSGHSPVYMVNSILWNNGLEISAKYMSDPRLSYCIVQGGYPGLENRDADPLFIDSEQSDFRLSQGSPGIDTGHTRIYDSDNSRSDIGAYGGEWELVPDRITVAADGSADFQSIQNAVDYALPGDTIAVFPGKYKENVIISGKDISLISEQGADSTIIDGSKSGSVITYINVKSGSLLDGFTIKNGLAIHNGGGIHCLNSSGTITNCFITKNRAHESGGGIGCYYKLSPIIDNCTIKANFAGFGGGGGIDCGDDLNAPVITNCLITENVNIGYSRDCGGGGIRCSMSFPTITHCTISKNKAFFGGGIRSSHGCNAIISDCIIEKNSALGNGGGIYCCSSMTINNCQINKNSANSSGGAIYWGALIIYPIDLNITNCTISRNRAISGGGIQFSGYFIPGTGGAYIHQPEITNCTITGNIAFSGGGISNFFSSSIINDSFLRRNFPNHTTSSRNAWGLRVINRIRQEKFSIPN